MSLIERGGKGGSSKDKVEWYPDDFGSAEQGSTSRGRPFCLLTENTELLTYCPTKTRYWALTKPVRVHPSSSPLLLV